jgi:hypothetical protein
MACARRKDRHIPTSDFDFTTLGSAQHQPRRTGRKPEHLVGGGMIVVEGVNAISPLRRPASALKERLEGRSSLFATFGVSTPRYSKTGRTGLFGTQSFASRRKDSGMTGDLPS